MKMQPTDHEIDKKGIYGTKSIKILSTEHARTLLNTNSMKMQSTQHIIGGNASFWTMKSTEHEINCELLTTQFIMDFDEKSQTTGHYVYSISMDEKHDSPICTLEVSNAQYTESG